MFLVNCTTLQIIKLNKHRQFKIFQRIVISSRTILMKNESYTKILLIFGTRPEAIKMAPVAMSLMQEELFDVKICITGQHREMLDQVLDIFEITPDYDLNLMVPNQTLGSLSAKILDGMETVFESYRPDYVLVHGDTTTSFIASLSAFYHDVKIGHVEAGLRTNNIKSPWPEEANRQLTAKLADIHFAPTATAEQNLISENIDPQSILVTGNTVIDALLWVEKNIKTKPGLKKQLGQNFLEQGIKFEKTQKNILITGHRRENFGEKFSQIIDAIGTLAKKNEKVNFIYPVHLNPNIKKPVYDALKNIENVFLIPPQDYISFVYLMINSDIILTDSGGIQEEAPSFGIPVLVMRDTTERPESVDAGTCVLVGSSKETIVNGIQQLLDDDELRKSYADKINPYGTGEASKLICHFLQHGRTQTLKIDNQ